MASTFSAASGVVTWTLRSVRAHWACTASSATAAAVRAAEALHERGGIGGIATHAEPEHDFAFGAVGKLEHHLQRGARIERRTHLARQPRAGQRRGIAQAAVAAEKLRAVARHAAARVVHVEERDPVGELGAVRIARHHRAALRVDLGDHVHRRLGLQIAQHPFHVAGGGEPARPAGVVAHLQHRELHRGVGGHVHAQFGVDAVFAMLEHRVAEAMPRHVGTGAAHG